MEKKFKIAFVVAAPITAKAFLLPFFEKLSGKYEVYLIANFSDSSQSEFDSYGVKCINVGIERKISLMRDLSSLFQLFRLFRKHKFDVVHSVTPKAGLLSMTSSRLAGVGVRLHTFTGQVWANLTGKRRTFLRLLDKLTFTFSSQVLVDSHSQRDFLIEESVVTIEKSTVLANGSISGVDIERFSMSESQRQEVREKIGIAESDFVFIYLGRMNRDKGIPELLLAFEEFQAEQTDQDSKLLLVGPDEEQLLNQINDPNVIIHGFTNTPELFMGIADVFCLPSHREGFGSVILEAASLNVPAMASRIYGLTDAVDDKKTGLLHSLGNVEEIVECMKLLKNDKDLYQTLANNCRPRARDMFGQEVITDALESFYEVILLK
jgi:glycosyltransferase involved in cell wall biosynthesis